MDFCSLVGSLEASLRLQLQQSFIGQVFCVEHVSLGSEFNLEINFLQWHFNLVVFFTGKVSYMEINFLQWHFNLDVFFTEQVSCSDVTIQLKLEWIQCHVVTYGSAGLGGG